MLNLPPNSLNVGIRGDEDQSFWSPYVFEFANIIRRMGGLEETLSQAIDKKDLALANRIFQEICDEKIKANSLTFQKRYAFLEQMCQSYLEAISYEAEKRIGKPLD